MKDEEQNNKNESPDLDDISIKCKVVLIGKSGVGKTSIISRYITDTFKDSLMTTPGANFITKKVDFPQYKKSIKFEIWDTAGQERYRSMAKLFYQDAKIIIFVYDFTSRSSFDYLINFWIPEVQITINVKNVIFGLVANKCDLYEIGSVSDEEGMDLADRINAVFQKTSAKLGLGVNTLFQNLGRVYLEPGFNYKQKDNNLF